MAEQVDQAAGRPQRQEQQLQERGLAGAGRTGEELEGVGRNCEIEVAQNLRAKPVTQADIFEPNQAQLRSMRGVTGNPKPVAHLCPESEVRTLLQHPPFANFGFERTQEIYDSSVVLVQKFS